MGRTLSDRKEQQASLWVPGTNRQGRLTYDLQRWPAEPEPAGNGRLCDEVVLIVRYELESRLSDERRRDLKGRAIRFVAFHFGVRNQDWGQALVQAMSQTVERAWENLPEAPTVVGSGCKVRQRQVLVSCCLTPDQEMAEKLLARLNTLEDKEWGKYLTLTEELVPRKPPQEQHKPSKPPGSTSGLARVPELAARLNAVPPDTDYTKAVTPFDEFLHGCRSAAAEWFAPFLERGVRAKVQTWQQEGQRPDLTLEQKKELSAWVNEELRSRGLAIRHDGRPCRLVIDTHTRYPDVGRFRLHPIGSPDRTTPRKTIEDFLPFELMEAPPRDEPLARWRDRVAGAKSSTRDTPPA